MAQLAVSGCTGVVSDGGFRDVGGIAALNTIILRQPLCPDKSHVSRGTRDKCAHSPRCRACFPG
ncbi:MAG: hypothetical protein ACU0FH_23120 [Heliomarina sp.]|uniref:hypothetical protein n=1 Tax=Heliomarina sp. TaxID=2917556 RepID=UPI00405901B5